MISAWARMCKIIGPAFVQYLPVVMGPLIQAASLKPEIAFVDCEFKLPQGTKRFINKILLIKYNTKGSVDTTSLVLTLCLVLCLLVLNCDVLLLLIAVNYWLPCVGVTMPV